MIYQLLTNIIFTQLTYPRPILYIHPCYCLLPVTKAFTKLRQITRHTLTVILFKPNQTKRHIIKSFLFCKAYVTSLLPSTEFFWRKNWHQQPICCVLRHRQATPSCFSYIPLASKTTMPKAPKPHPFHPCLLPSLLLKAPLPILLRARASLHMAPISNGMDHDLPHHLAKLPARVIIMCVISQPV